MLEQFYLQELVNNALKEDLPWGDLTTNTLISDNFTSKVEIRFRSKGIIAGLDIAKLVFKTIDPAIQFNTVAKDGVEVDKGTVIAAIEGKTASILKAERVALNFLQQLSGIATKTATYVNAAHKGNANTKVVDTRKTIAGMRNLHKYAILMGGGNNHRHCLSDAILIKDNHLAGLLEHNVNLTDALLQLRKKVSHTTFIQMEVDRIDQIQPGLDANIDGFLLDNMSLEDLKKAVQFINKKAITEASGGVTLESITSIAACGVDIISVGALTNSIQALDIGLDYLD